MRSDVREGGMFPDYELDDQAGKRRSLSELQGGNAMVLHLSRGGFDPKEHRFLRHLVDAYPDFRNVLYAIGSDIDRQSAEHQRVPGRSRCDVAVPIGPGSNGPKGP